MAAVLNLKDLCKEYSRGGRSFFAVDHVSLTVESGDFVNVIGRSGSGKSTLLNLAAGMLAPTSGSVELDGVELAGKSDAELSRLRCDRIGFIPQGAAALPNLTVLENVMLPFCLYPRGGDGEGAARLLLERFGIGATADSYPGELSGGQNQRVAIARALALSPDILCFDEPTSALDPELTGEVLRVIRALAEQKTTMIIVTHEMAFARDVADQVVFMDGGVIVEQGDARQVIEHPREERTRQFLARYSEN